MSKEAEFFTAIKAADVTTAANLIRTNPEVLDAKEVVRYGSGEVENVPAIHVAIEMQNTDMVKLMLDAKPGLTKEVLETGRSTAAAAAYEGDVETLKLLLDKDPALLQSKDQAGDTLMHDAVRSLGNDKVLTLLMEKAPEMAAIQNKEGYNALDLSFSIENAETLLRADPTLKLHPKTDPERVQNVELIRTRMAEPLATPPDENLPSVSDLREQLKTAKQEFLQYNKGNPVKYPHGKLDEEWIGIADKYNEAEMNYKNALKAERWGKDLVASDTKLNPGAVLKEFSDAQLGEASNHSALLESVNERVRLSLNEGLTGGGTGRHLDQEREFKADRLTQIRNDNPTDRGPAETLVGAKESMQATRDKRDGAVGMSPGFGGDAERVMYQDRVDHWEASAQRVADGVNFRNERNHKALEPIMKAWKAEEDAAVVASKGGDSSLHGDLDKGAIALKYIEKVKELNRDGAVVDGKHTGQQFLLGEPAYQKMLAAANHMKNHGHESTRGDQFASKAVENIQDPVRQMSEGQKIHVEQGGLASGPKAEGTQAEKSAAAFAKADEYARNPELVKRDVAAMKDRAFAKADQQFLAEKAAGAHKEPSALRTGVNKLLDKIRGKDGEIQKDTFKAVLDADGNKKITNEELVQAAKNTGVANNKDVQEIVGMMKNYMEKQGIPLAEGSSIAMKNTGALPAPNPTGSKPEASAKTEAVHR